jgi:hypothetical protein
MSLTRNKMVALGAGALVAAGGTGAALASNDNGTAPRHEAATPTAQPVGHATADVKAAFAALRRPARLTTRQRHERRALRRQFRHQRLRATFTRADYAAARPVHVSGSSDDAWLAPSGDKVCVYLPDPVDGFGTTCVSAADAQAGRGVLVLTPQANSSDQHIRVAVIVPDGGAAPDVSTADGTESTLPVVNNVAAAVLPASAAKLETAAGALDLALMTRQPDPSCWEKAASAGSGPTNCPLR